MPEDRGRCPQRSVTLLERGVGGQGNAQFTGNSFKFSPNLHFFNFCRKLCSRDISCDRGPRDTPSLDSDCTGKQLLLLQNPPLPGSAMGKPGRQCCHYLVVSVLQRRGLGVWARVWTEARAGGQAHAAASHQGRDTPGLTQGRHFVRWNVGRCQMDIRLRRVSLPRD